MTTERPLVRSLFKLHDTYGCDLGMAIHYMLNRGSRPDLYSFVLDAKKAGWKRKKIWATLSEAIDIGFTVYTKPNDIPDGLHETMCNQRSSDAEFVLALTEKALDKEFPDEG